MREIHLNFDVKFSPRFIRVVAVGAIVLAAVPEIGSESVTLATYYPAPSGVYTNMITTGNTYLARDTGNVGIRTTTPSTLLHVNGTFTAGGAATFNNAITGALGFIPSYASWAAYGTGSGGAAIYNDAAAYQALMIVGNNSAGGVRRVKVWDDLLPQGHVHMTTAGTSFINQKTDCASVAFASGLTTCAGGTYATLISGVMTKTQIIVNGVDPSGMMLCCPCPASGCPAF